MHILLVSCLAVVSSLHFVSCQQDLPLWSKELLRPYFLEASSSVESSPDYDASKPIYPSRQSSSSSPQLKKRVAMGVDLPDYILHYRGKSPDLVSFRERMQMSGRR